MSSHSFASVPDFTFAIPDAPIRSNKLTAADLGTAINDAFDRVYDGSNTSEAFWTHVAQIVAETAGIPLVGERT